jgi:hypothetical protein
MSSNRGGLSRSTKRIGWHYWLWGLIVCCIMVLLSKVAAEEHQSMSVNQPILKVRPSHCVVFREGQYCEKNIQIEWQTSKIGNYCLFVDESLESLMCWQNLASGSFIIEKKITQSTSYFLREKDSQKEIAHQIVTVAWVYDAIRKNRATWRLF